MTPDTSNVRGEITDSPRWQRLKSILADALEEESAEARAAFIERSCADDVDLLRDAESLLAEAESLLRDANDDLEACADNAETRIPRDNVSEIGKRVGAYVIIREIGQGGMGTVYLGARADGYFEKQVAIKLLTRGADTEEVLRRFRSEREVLARLDHPNIARLLDAGTTDEGLPYFVMEYVDGTPITRFIEENQAATMAARLALFLKICAAVEVAHRNSVVHRDLKPGNILVTREGEPKLLDFGIAKLIGNDTNPLELTAVGQQRLTPISASPEQAQGELVTKSSDIYALGVLLYEMLTGVKPHRFRTRNPSRDELVSVVCEQAPVPPSMAAKDRGVSRSLRGDLEAIVLCALQKEPARRYSSVADFAEDIRRHLARKPVKARSGHAARRLLSAAFHGRRRQILIAAVSILLLAMALGIWNSKLGSEREKASLQPASNAAIPEKSIAVLPFDNFGAGEESSYFVDGVQDNILTDLAKVSDLKVISRTSVASYRGGARNAREIGRILGVSYVLEGSVQKSGDRIRVNAQLIDTRTEAGVWAEHYDRKIDDLFILQSELAQTIVSQLKATLSPNEKAAIERWPTKDMLAYDLYLRARESFLQFDNRKSIELLEAAIARDSQFTLAYCLLAESQLYMYRFMGEATPARLAAAKEAADAALRLAPNLAESHLAQAQYYYYGVRDYEKTQRELTMARSPADRAKVIDLTALTERRLGQWKDSIRHAEEAAALDPQSPYVTNELIESYIAVRRFKEAGQLADKAIKLQVPTASNALWMLKSESLVGLGQLEEARAVLKDAPKNNENRSLRLAETAMFARDYAQAMQHVADVPSAARESHSLLLLEGMIARAQGAAEKAQSAFQAARDRLVAKLVEQANDPELLSGLSLANAGLGREEEARQGAEQVVRLVPTSRDAVDGPVYATRLAQVYAWTGDNEAALRELAEVVKRPCGPSYGTLQFDPVWDGIRGDHRFAEIVRQAAEPLTIE
jgi:serine/threonine protein kinase/tetratricopeptide (TPR) repeat protein